MWSIVKRHIKTNFPPKLYIVYIIVKNIENLIFLRYLQFFVFSPFVYFKSVTSSKIKIQTKNSKLPLNGDPGPHDCGAIFNTAFNF